MCFYFVDVFPVRIKRKRNDAKRKADKEDTFLAGNSDSSSQAERTFNSRGEQTHKQENLDRSGDESRTCDSIKSDAAEEIKNSHLRTVEEEHAYYRSIYPNLQGLKEFINPIADKKEENAGPSNHSRAEPSTSGVRFEPYPVNILPEKVFETVSNVWKTVYNTKKSLSENEHFPKQVQETVTSVFNTVSSEINNAANAARTAAATAAAAATSAVPTSVPNDIPMPTSNPATATTNNTSASADSNSATAAASASSSESSQSSTASTSVSRRGTT